MSATRMTATTDAYDQPRHTAELLAGAPAAIDRMTAGREPEAAIAIALVAAYAGARLGGVLFDNGRNAIFERVGQDATRRLAEATFRHLHDLSLRFHLARRTGAVTKIIERGTKSIDTMLYFLLFNIGPTVVQLTIVLTLFWIKFGVGLVAAIKKDLLDFMRIGRLDTLADAVGRDVAAVTAEPWPG